MTGAPEKSGATLMGNLQEGLRPQGEDAGGAQPEGLGATGRLELGEWWGADHQRPPWALSKLF